MPLPEYLRIALVERFSPILCIDPEEPSYPVSPPDYVRAAALWASTPPEHPRMGWGRPGAVGREPLVPHGGIVLDADGTMPGLGEGEGERERERWLDHRGWQDGPEVLPSSVNRRALIDDGALEQPWFTCDVWTLADLMEGIGPEQFAPRFGLGPEDRPPQLDRVAVLSFGFLFPGHRQPRRRTLRDPAEDPWSGDYEGDWCHFSVVLRCGVEDMEGADAGDFVPLTGCFGQRLRGTNADRDGHATERALLRPWSSLIRVGDHPVVVASAGIHNLHPHDPPLNPDGGIDLKWVDFGKTISEPANDFVQKAVEQPAAALFSAKVLAGAAAGSFLGGLAGAAVGAIVGGIAAAAEAAEAEKEGLYDVPKLGEEAPPPPPGEDPVSEDAVDLAKDKVAKSALAANPPFFDPAQAESRDWACTAGQALADGAWVVAIQDGLLASDGRWGVRCDHDGFQIRSGLRLPAYRFHVVDALLQQA